MHRLSGKCELIAIQLAGLKKVIQKNAAIAFRVAVARNKAGNTPLVFDGEFVQVTVEDQGRVTGKKLYMPE